MRIDQIEARLGFRIGDSGLEVLDTRLNDRGQAEVYVRAVQPVIGAETARRMYALLLELADTEEVASANLRVARSELETEKVRSDGYKKQLDRMHTAQLNNKAVDAYEQKNGIGS